ncbi:MAG: serine/threonine-protein kinase [Planctomycetes bacterium]|nr:serine/threonine-protein kinase [Planctomycetota bacterium]
MSDADEKGDKRRREKEVPPTASFGVEGRVPGGQIGQFRIESELGRGGMGVVYLAHDTKLDRQVAIKSLPAELMDNPKARSRFSREARVLASLNHPNIATIYEELKEAEGAGFLVLEYVPGDTLAERIGRKRLKVKEALTIGLQIAEGVAAAHEKGIIHRDLKAGNIKITPEGKVKVLDFGLARAISGETLNQQSTITEPGRIIGTPAYMSPEQARGEQTDERSDIWSFGCVLYEMLTGRIPFEGATPSDTLANILTYEPDWQMLPQNLPANIRVLLRRCLEKDPRRRLRDIGDAGLEIEAAMAEPAPDIAGLASSSDASRIESWRRYFPWCVAACMFLLSVFFYLRVDTPLVTGPRARERSHIVLPVGQPYALSYIGWQTSIAISPDGNRIAYVGWGPRGKQLFLRELDQWQSVPIEGTEDARSPFFSPNAERLAFFTTDQLKVFSLRTHELRKVWRVLAVTAGGCWESQNSILFLPTPDGDLMRVHIDGGKPEIAFANKAPDSTRHLYSPKMLPYGKSVLLSVVDSDANEPLDPGLAVVDLETQKLEKLGLRGTSAHYDHKIRRLVFASGGNILSVPFDVNRRKVMGEPDLIDTGVIQRGIAAELTLSSDGKLVYAPGSGTSGRKLVRVDPQEQAPDVLETGAFGAGVRLSPSEQLLAIARDDSDGNTDIHIFDPARGRWDRRLTFSKNTDSLPIWTPDGKRVTYCSYGTDAPNLFWKELGGAPGSAELLLEKPAAQFPTSWSPSGNTLAFTHEDPETHYDIWLLHLDESGQVEKTEELLATEHVETGAVFSPDGHWIAYQSNESGRYEIYIEPFPPQKSSRITVSTDGGTEPLWARDKERLRLFYRNGERMMAVDFLAEPKPHTEDPKILFEGQYYAGSIRAYYDVTTDGRFLMIQLAEGESPGQLNVIVNWHQKPEGN